MTMSGRKVIVTGAAGSLGKAVVQAFRKEGASVAAIDKTGEMLSGALGAESGELKHYACDLLDAKAVSDVVGRAVAQFGRVDAVCNIAGGFTMGDPVHKVSDDTWDLMMNMNVRTFLNVARAVIPSMESAGGGRIVAIGAMGAQRGGANMSAYAASKRALQTLVESMSAESRAKGINVNAVLPSIIDTPANRHDMPKADPAKWVAPEALAKVILFLCSDDAKPIHGVALPVQGLS